MENQIHVKELAWKLFSETHTIWTQEETKKQWDGDFQTRELYEWYAVIALRYFESIYYSL